MARRIAKLIGLGGGGAAAGALGMDALGLTAAGTVGSGIGFGTSALILGATGGGLFVLACYGLYRCLKG